MASVLVIADEKLRMKLGDKKVPSMRELMTVLITAISIADRNPISTSAIKTIMLASPSFTPGTTCGKKDSATWSLVAQHTSSAIFFSFLSSSGMETTLITDGIILTRAAAWDLDKHFIWNTDNGLRRAGYPAGIHAYLPRAIDRKS